MKNHEDLLQEITQLQNEKRQLEIQLTSINQAIENLRKFAYERAPKLMAEEANKQTATLREENQRLRQELGYIAQANPRDFVLLEGFQRWAQNRARLALGEEAGTLSIKKGNQQ